MNLMEYHQEEYLFSKVVSRYDTSCILPALSVVPSDQSPPRHSSFSRLRVARFWYISLVACHRDPVTCEWRHTRQPITVQYDIWLVNGDPRKRAQNPLEYQFSFDEQVSQCTAANGS